MIFSVTGGDGFAAFRDPDSIVDSLSDLVASDSEGYAALAKPNEADPKTQADAYARVSKAVAGESRLDLPY